MINFYFINYYLKYLINIILAITILFNYLFCIFFSKFLININFKKKFITSFIQKIVDINILIISNLSVFSNLNIKKINLEGKFIINCNHINEIDDLLTLVVLKKLVPNYSFKNTKSVSMVTSKLEEYVFDYNDCIVINNQIDFNIIDKKIKKISKACQNLILILFLEGALNDKYNKIMEKNNDIYFNNLKQPKLSLFDSICKLDYFKFLVDINVVYNLKNKILTKSDNILLFLDPNCKAYFSYKIYNLPKENTNKWVYDLFQKKDIELEIIKKTITYSI